MSAVDGTGHSIIVSLNGSSGSEAAGHVSRPVAFSTSRRSILALREIRGTLDKFEQDRHQADGLRLRTRYGAGGV